MMGHKEHLVELKRKHRKLDEEIIELEKSYVVDDEIRKLKTKKLWYKDEIHRLENIIAFRE